MKVAKFCQCNLWKKILYDDVLLLSKTCIGLNVLVKVAVVAETKSNFNRFVT